MTATAKSSAPPHELLADLVREACSRPRELIAPQCGLGRSMDRAGSLLRPKIIGAQRFVMNDDATALAATIGALSDPLDEDRNLHGLDWDDPAMLLAAMPRCRAPYATTWVEWSPQARPRR